VRVRSERFTWSIAAALVCAAGVEFVAPANGAFPGRNGRIAYGEDECGTAIATLRPDGTRRRLLTPSPCGISPGPAARAPAWAPDGSRLVFEWTENGVIASGLATADADGKHRTVVVADTERSPDAAGYVFRGSPAFSPDGRHVVYQRDATDRDSSGGQVSRPSELWIASIDGSQDARLGEGQVPRWSPDGRTIAYVNRRQGGTWLMSARTGKRLRRVWRLRAESLDWAPDGRRLVAALDGYIYVLRADGRGARRLPLARRKRKPHLRNMEPVWSPDGSRIAFVRERLIPQVSGEFDRQEEIWTASASGTRPRRIWKRNDGFDSDTSTPTLSWQPLPD
jgi:Tol biopolymer transport system component